VTVKKLFKTNAILVNFLFIRESWKNIYYGFHKKNSKKKKIQYW